MHEGRESSEKGLEMKLAFTDEAKATFQCFYCDRTTTHAEAVNIRLTNGLLSCADCTAHDSSAEFWWVHNWDGSMSLVDTKDIDGVCSVCGSGEFESCLP